MMNADAEEWTIGQAAEHIGASSTGSARKLLSRWGIPAIRYERGPSGRTQARYSADAVRNAAASRPGQGTRTDRKTP